MKVFLTGATGYIGSVVAEHLQQAGHTVIGLARSDESAAKLTARNVQVYRGDLADTASLAAPVNDADATIHTGMDMSRGGEGDKSAVEAMLAARGGKPFVYTSGIWVIGNTGERIADETAPLNPPALVAWRPAIEQIVWDAGGVVIRPGMVYGRGGGILGAFAKEPVVIGDGENRWPVVDVDDLADLYVRALNAAPGSLYFAVSGASFKVRDIARRFAGGATLQFVPLEEARKTLGAYADALTLDQQVSASKAELELGWSPKSRL